MHLKISLYVKESDGKEETTRECKDEEGKCVSETSLTAYIYRDGKGVTDSCSGEGGMKSHV